MQVQFLDIPAEVIVCNILPLLSLHDLSAVCQTCKQLNRIAQDEKLWKQHLLEVLGSDGTFKSSLFNALQLQRHLEDINVELENEGHARNAAEKTRMLLDSYLDRETCYNQELRMKVKALECTIMSMEEQNNQIHLEADLRLQEVESLRRKEELYEERIAGKDRELKLLERRKENLEAEMKEFTEELSELRASKRDLVKANRQLRTELVKAMQNAQFQNRDPMLPTVAQLVNALPKNKF